MAAVSSCRGLLDPGLEPAPAALAGGFSTTEVPGKPISFTKVLHPSQNPTGTDSWMLCFMQRKLQLQLGYVYPWKIQDNGCITRYLGFPGGSVVKNLPANEGVRGPSGSIPGLRRAPGEGNGTHSIFLAWEIHGQRSLVGYSPWGHKELDMTEQLSMYPTHQILEFLKSLDST